LLCLYLFFWTVFVFILGKCTMIVPCIQLFHDNFATRGSYGRADGFLI
jgi:hypothetical protein